MSPLLLRYFSFSDSMPSPGQPQQRHRPPAASPRAHPKIGQQAEVQMLVPIGQEADFQRFDQSLDVLRAREHRRHHHQGTGFGRNSFGKIHPRQRLRPYQQRRQPVTRAIAR